MSRPPKFKRVAAGDYETEDGRYRLRQLDGGATRAWNVEVADVEIARWVDADPENRSAYDYPDPCPVDGAATKSDALALFAEWWSKREQEETMENLTESGRAWAEKNAADSIVATVALHGEDAEPKWPEAFVNAARGIANDEGAKTRPAVEAVR